MFEIIFFTLHILAAPAETQASECHWLTVDLGKREIGRRQRKRACRWEPTVQRSAKSHDIDPDLLGALIVIESGWKPWVVSGADACGLTQVIPKWTGGAASGRRKYTCDQLKRPEISIPVGARILRWWIDYHAAKLAKNKNISDEDKQKLAIREGLCGYNAGFRGCKRAGARYARKVLKIQKALKDPRDIQTDKPANN